MYNIIFIINKKESDILEKFSLIVVAAGSSARMGGVSKQTLVLNNIPVVCHSLIKFNKIGLINDIVVVTRSADINLVKYYVKENNITKVLNVVAGGETRQQSVANGMRYIDTQTEYIAIHDGARPLILKKDIINVLKNAIIYGSSVLGVLAKDTIKEIDSEGFIKTTFKRENLIHAQTPQAFNKKNFIECINHCIRNGLDFTDDSQMYEKMGYKIFFTEGSYSNLKITTKEDILLAKNLILDIAEKEKVDE